MYANYITSNIAIPVKDDMHSYDPYMIVSFHNHMHVYMHSYGFTQFDMIHQYVYSYTWVYINFITGLWFMPYNYVYIARPIYPL